MCNFVCRGEVLEVTIRRGQTMTDVLLEMTERFPSGKLYREHKCNGYGCHRRIKLEDNTTRTFPYVVLDMNQTLTPMTCSFGGDSATGAGPCKKPLKNTKCLYCPEHQLQYGDKCGAHIEDYMFPEGRFCEEPVVPCKQRGLRYTCKDHWPIETQYSRAVMGGFTHKQAGQARQSKESKASWKQRQSNWEEERHKHRFCRSYVKTTALGVSPCGIGLFIAPMYTFEAFDEIMEILERELGGASCELPSSSPVMLAYLCFLRA